jgi:acyl-CoA synthetase
MDLADLVEHLTRRGVSREWFPERLVLVDELPTSEGGKVAKAALRSDLQRQLTAESPPAS